MQIFTVLFLTLALAGCVTPAKQTEALLREPLALPKAHLIENVPFIEQSAGYCGPATLAMALGWTGKNISLDEIAPQVYTPGMKGSLQTDMLTASRRNGMMALPIEGMPALIKEISAGNPVIVFENLSVSWAPVWHYAIVFGYDLEKPEVLMHSGPESFKHWNMRTFERSWMLGNYWGLVVLPPDKLSASANELTHVQAASALELLGKVNEAETAYQTILSRWPQSLAALIGAANFSYQREDFKKAIGFLTAATSAHPESAAAWHNLAIAQGSISQGSIVQDSMKNKKSAQKSAEKAMSLVSGDLKKDYSENLKQWLL